MIYQPKIFRFDSDREDIFQRNSSGAAGSDQPLVYDGIVIAKKQKSKPMTGLHNWQRFSKHTKHRLVLNFDSNLAP